MFSTPITTKTRTPRLRRSTRKNSIQDEEDIKSEVNKRRLASLENDNFNQDEFYLEQMTQDRSDDDEYNDDEVEFATSKRKKRRKSKKVDKNRQKYFPKRDLDNILYQEKTDQLPPEVPSYYNCNMGKSAFPKRHFCSVCGFQAAYTCTTCGERYCCVKCLGVHKDSRCQKFVA